MNARRYLFLAGVSLALIAADQGTKWWAVANLAERRMVRSRPVCINENEEAPVERRARYFRLEPIVVIEGLFSLSYVENCAGAFGLLRSQDQSVRRPFFLIVSAAAILFIILLFRRLTSDQKLLMWALPFVLGGALGNLIDRIHLRYVIDFIDVYHEDIGRWPTFNIADVAIVIGVGLILIDMVPRRSSARKEEEPNKKPRSKKKPETEKTDQNQDENSETETSKD